MKIVEPQIKPIAVTETATYERINDINTKGSFFSVRAEINAMLKQEPKQPLGGRRPAQRGAIVNLASVASYKSLPHSVSYVTSKHAVVGLTKSAGW